MKHHPLAIVILVTIIAIIKCLRHQKDQHFVLTIDKYIIPQKFYCCLLLSYILFFMVMITTNTLHKIRSSSSSSSSSSSPSNFSYRRSFPAARGGETSSSSASHRTSRLVLASDLDNGFMRKALTVITDECDIYLFGGVDDELMTPMTPMITLRVRPPSQDVSVVSKGRGV